MKYGNDERVSTFNSDGYVPYRTRQNASKGGNFSEQEVDLATTPLYFAEGFEKLFIALYIIILPYIAGLIFLFLYVAEAKFELFINLKQSNSLLLTWAIGYEILASFLLLYLMKSAITFSRSLGKKNKKFQIP